MRGARGREDENDGGDYDYELETAEKAGLPVGIDAAGITGGKETLHGISERLQAETQVHAYICVHYIVSIDEIGQKFRPSGQLWTACLRWWMCFSIRIGLDDMAPS